MEIINVESRTWEMMMARLEAFVQRVETLCHCTVEYIGCACWHYVLCVIIGSVVFAAGAFLWRERV